jgi:hypothetical protein
MEGGKVEELVGTLKGGTWKRTRSGTAEVEVEE